MRIPQQGNEDHQRFRRPRNGGQPDQPADGHGIPRCRPLVQALREEELCSVKGEQVPMRLCIVHADVLDGVRGQDHEQQGDRDHHITEIAQQDFS